MNDNVLKEAKSPSPACACNINNEIHFNNVDCEVEHCEGDDTEPSGLVARKQAQADGQGARQ